MVYDIIEGKRKGSAGLVDIVVRILDMTQSVGGGTVQDDKTAPMRDSYVFVILCAPS